MYKLTRTIRNLKTKKFFVKEMKMIDKVERLENKLKFHFAGGGATYRTKDRLEEHCAVVWIMKEKEIKEYEQEQKEKEEQRQKLYDKVMAELFTY